MNAYDETAAFLDQNDISAQTLTYDEVDDHTTHHSGGLVVVGGYMPDGRYVKMHDTWGPSNDDGTYPVIVHGYDPDDDFSGPMPAASEFEEEYATGREAFDRFTALLTDAGCDQPSPDGTEVYCSDPVGHRDDHHARMDHPDGTHDPDGDVITAWPNTNGENA